MTTSPFGRGRTVCLFRQLRALSTSHIPYPPLISPRRISRCSPEMGNPKMQQVSVTGFSATMVGALLCWARPPPLFCVSRPPMTHLHEKLLHEKRRHLARAARSDGHFNGLHRPQNKTTTLGSSLDRCSSQWERQDGRNPSESRSSSSATCRT